MSNTRRSCRSAQFEQNRMDDAGGARDVSIDVDHDAAVRAVGAGRQLGLLSIPLRVCWRKPSSQEWRYRRRPRVVPGAARPVCLVCHISLAITRTLQSPKVSERSINTSTSKALPIVFSSELKAKIENRRYQIPLAILHPPILLRPPYPSPVCSP